MASINDLVAQLKHTEGFILEQTNRVVAANALTRTRVDEAVERIEVALADTNIRLDKVLTDDPAPEPEAESLNLKGGPLVSQ